MEMLAYKDLFNKDETIIELQEGKKVIRLRTRLDKLEERIVELESELQRTNEDLDTCMEKMRL